MAQLITGFALIISVIAWVPASYTDEQLIELDFGRVTSGAIAERTFVIAKSIHNIVVPCECVTLKPLSKPDENPTTLSIEFDSRGYEGDVIQDIILVDDQENLITVRLRADVK